MIRRLLLFMFLLHSAAAVYGQIAPDSIYSVEKEDSVSSLAIKLLKPSQTRKLLKQIIERFQLDLQQEHEMGKYRIDATFSRDTLAPFSVSRTITAKAGVALSRSDVTSTIYEYDYQGTYKLNRQDSIYIGGYLNQFAQLSPDHVPYVSPISMGRRTPYGPSLRNMWIHVGNALLPLRDYKTTSYYYKVEAYSIDDASGRGVYRIIFSRNGESRLIKYGDKKYDVGELTGTAYFDSSTLSMTKFKGKARLLSDKHVIHITYLIDYKKESDTPILQRNRILYEAGGTKIRATVQRLNEN